MQPTMLAHNMYLSRPNCPLYHLFHLTIILLKGLAHYTVQEQASSLRSAGSHIMQLPH